MPKICGSTYPVSRNMLEYYLSQKGFTPISIEETEKKEVYSVYTKDKDSIQLYYGNVYDRPTVRSILEPRGFSLDDFESFVYNLKMTEEAFDTIIDDCLNVPTEEVKRAAKEWEQNKNTES
ncbi:MAG: hypothetical protein SO084_15890 [Butyricimonas virosa]|nr:hypothetical protein [Butyricimonas virosa]